MSQKKPGKKTTSLTNGHETPGEPVPDRSKYTPLWQNTVTILGMFLTAMALLLLLSFALFNLVSPAHNQYVDIVGLLVLPGILIVGLFTVPLGILIKSWRVRRRRPDERLVFGFPRIDLNDPAQLRVAKIGLFGAFILLPVVGVSSYHGYHYTDSSSFCAKACHAAMHPQATTYEHSAHARVPCADCHIGSGAGWFVKSKLSGTRQVFAMWRDSYSRPIPPAISELRPARDTCEQCHWPQKFFGAQLREIVTYASDEENTRREINMLIKTGGGDEVTGRAEGIHLHMVLQGRIKYIAKDDLLQIIPWIEYTTRQGERLVYRSDGRPSSNPKPAGQERILDCMDCHNRPAHKFRSPQEAVDIYLDVGKIDDTLPFIKREATKVLARRYPDLETAEKRIAGALEEFYRTNHPELWAAEKASVNHAIDRVREIYAYNSFPKMNVDWRTYPDNIGHMISPGCFRCHDGAHVNQHGERLSNDCKICHSFLYRLDQSSDTGAVRTGDFVHSYELQGSHAKLRCDRCHTGGAAPAPDCEGCHVEPAAFRLGASEVFSSFEIEADSMAEDVDCESCHDLTEPTNIETINAKCMDCHDDEEERFEGMLASWEVEVARLLAEAGEQVDAEGERLLTALRQAGPLHNLEASRLILNRLIADRTSASLLDKRRP